MDFRRLRILVDFGPIMRRVTLAVGWAALAVLLAVMPICAQAHPPLQAAESDATNPDNEVYKVGHGITPPMEVSAPAPAYAETARKVGYEGTCAMTLIVGSDGSPRNIRVVRPLGMGLDDKALEAVHQWRFKPATKDGEPVSVKVNIEVNFRLYANGESKGPTTFQKANAGDAKAQLEIAQMLLSDPYMVNDDSKGFSFLEKAAKQNFPPAQFAMGEYFSSRKNDLVSAYVWYSLARKSRYKQSDEKLRDLAEKMTPEQLAEARQRVDRSIEIRN